MTNRGAGRRTGEQDDEPGSRTTTLHPVRRATPSDAAQIAECLAELGHGTSAALVAARLREHAGSAADAAFVAAAEAFAWEADCRRVEVTSGDHRPGAHAFYRALGYAEDERRFVKRAPGTVPSRRAAPRESQKGETCENNASALRTTVNDVGKSRRVVLALFASFRFARRVA